MTGDDDCVYLAVGRHRKRGALLMEVVLALALFVSGGLMILSAVSNSTGSIQRWRDRAVAADLARSAMARIEAGIEVPDAMSGPVPAWRDESDLGFDDDLPPDTEWELEVLTEPSTFRGLTLVRVTAFRSSELITDPAQASVRFTIAQLVRLGDLGGDGVGEEDAISRAAREGAARNERRDRNRGSNRSRSDEGDGGAP